jgi:hypothetical protein
MLRSLRLPQDRSKNVKALVLLLIKERLDAWYEYLHADRIANGSWCYLGRVFALILSLAPYMSGADFGIFKVPFLGQQTQKRLKILGPLSLVLAILLFVPFWESGKLLTSEKVKQCLAEAEKRDRPYVIEALTMLVQVEHEPLTQATRRRHFNRIIYTLRPLKDLEEGHRFFKEVYASSYDLDQEFEHWFGSEREEPHGTGTEYDVLFQADRGDVRTVVTGSNYAYALPLQNDRVQMARFRLPGTEDMVIYNNDQDVICELNIVVESRSLNLRPVGRAAKKLSHTGDDTPKDAELHPREPSHTDLESISARWTNVMPDEEVGIHFTWREP